MKGTLRISFVGRVGDLHLVVRDLKEITIKKKIKIRIDLPLEVKTSADDT